MEVTLETAGCALCEGSGYLHSAVRVLTLPSQGPWDDVLDLPVCLVPQSHQFTCSNTFEAVE